MAAKSNLVPVLYAWVQYPSVIRAYIKIPLVAPIGCGICGIWLAVRMWRRQLSGSAWDGLEINAFEEVVDAEVFDSVIVF